MGYLRVNLLTRRYRRALLTTIVAVSCFAASAPAPAVGDPEKHWEQLQNDGTTALDSNEYWKAEPLLRQAVIQAGTFGIDDIRLAKSLGTLGRLYTVRGRFAQAEPLLEEELCVKEKALGRGNG